MATTGTGLNLVTVCMSQRLIGQQDKQQGLGKDSVTMGVETNPHTSLLFSLQNSKFLNLGVKSLIFFFLPRLPSNREILGTGDMAGTNQKAVVRS